MRRIHPEIRLRSRQLRRPLTPAEQKLWDCLRGKQFNGYKFRRQHPIGFYIVDFYCALVKLVIEVDGDSHAGQIEYDRERCVWLQAQGYTIIRFTNRQVLEQLEAVINEIQTRLDAMKTASSRRKPLPQQE